MPRRWRKPYVVVDVRADPDKGEHLPYESFLSWMRSEGINPEDGTRCEVYRGLRGPYAVVTLFCLHSDGSKVVDMKAEAFETRRKRVPLSSLPPLQEV